MDEQTLAILMVLGFFFLIFMGFPVAIAIAASGLLFGYLGFGMGLFTLLPIRIYGVVTNYNLMAVPLFVFLGVMLERSHIVEALLDVIGHIAGKVRGGMGLAIICVGVLMGASTGIVGATVVTLGLLTLPTFIRRGYNKALACGTICASGTLGQIIPPSLVLLLLADLMGESVGTLFAAAMVPGLVMATIYAVYMLMVGWLLPDMAPSIPTEERALMTPGKLWLKFFKVVLPPIFLIVAVLGSIIGGIAAPTEAASMGAFGSILIVAVTGHLNKKVLTETVQNTLKISAMVFFILIGAQVFSLAFRGLDGDELILKLFTLIPGGVTADIIFMLGLLFILGFFLEWIEICYIVLPMFLPIFNHTDVNMVWLAALICLVIQTSFLTPPVGWSLFFLRGVAPPEVATRDIYLGVLPFVVMQVIAVAVVFQYPQIATWLPHWIGW
ncbi:MAG: TRAP transporter large permease subunit [Gammaproteobacteria bacterium]|nr:TRAP transporter large permease subunit [Gammaproteobacteria bacterium]